MEMGFAAAGTAANGGGAAAATNGGGAAAATNGGGGKAPAAAAIREQDRLMPIANVIRIMRRVLPPHAKISDDAKETIQECVSEYISFITGEANERCQREQRKTITAEDVLWAMSRLGFDDYVHPLGVYLHRFREFEGEARGAGGSLRSPRGAPGSASSSMMVPQHHHHDMQMHAAAMYGSVMPPPPPHHHAFLMPPQPHHAQYGQQYEMYGGGEHGTMGAYYGGGYAPGNGGHNGDSGGGGAGTPQAVNFEHQPFGYK